MSEPIKISYWNTNPVSAIIKQKDIEFAVTTAIVKLAVPKEEQEKIWSLIKEYTKACMITSVAIVCDEVKKCLK